MTTAKGSGTMAIKQSSPPGCSVINKRTQGGDTVTILCCFGAATSVVVAFVFNRWLKKKNLSTHVLGFHTWCSRG